MVILVIQQIATTVETLAREVIKIIMMAGIIIIKEITVLKVLGTMMVAIIEVEVEIGMTTRETTNIGMIKIGMISIETDIEMITVEVIVEILIIGDTNNEDSIFVMGIPAIIPEIVLNI